MRRVGPILVAFVLAASCSSKAPPAPTPAPTVAITDLSGGVLTADDMGKGWTAVKDPQPDTFQIGGKIGTSTYIKDAAVTKTVSFTQDNASGFVTNTVFVLPSVTAAQTVMSAHANQPTTWRQSRTDGGYLDATYVSAVPGLEQRGGGR